MRGTAAENTSSPVKINRKLDAMKNVICVQLVLIGANSGVDKGQHSVCALRLACSRLWATPVSLAQQGGDTLTPGPEGCGAAAAAPGHPQA